MLITYIRTCVYDMMVNGAIDHSVFVGNGDALGTKDVLMSVFSLCDSNGSLSLSSLTVYAGGSEFAFASTCSTCKESASSNPTFSESVVYDGGLSVYCVGDSSKAVSS